MKIRTLFITALFTCLSYSAYTQNTAGKDIQQNDTSKKEFEEIKTLVDSAHFVFRANIVYPLGYEPIRLTRIDNFLLILGNKAGADLPFFGRANTISYADIKNTEDGKGIAFSGQMKDYKVVPDETKNKISVSFTVDEDDDAFHCILDIYAGGNAMLSITSQNRTSISYHGSVYLYKKS
jgi:hypothetical protein